MASPQHSENPHTNNPGPIKVLWAISPHRGRLGYSPVYSISSNLKHGNISLRCIDLSRECPSRSLVAYQIL